MATGGLSHEDPLGTKKLQDVQLAIAQANARRGYRNRLPCKLIVRNDNGLWSASGNEAIHLAYREKVWAVIGSIDGASTHVAEQVATKARITLISPLSGGPTLTHTAVPWMFRLPPDDAADVLIRAICGAGLNRARIRDAVAEMSDYAGLAGTITWDNGGGNIVAPLPVIVCNGRFVAQSSGLPAPSQVSDIPD